MASPPEPPHPPEEPPPLLGSWRALYLVVIGSLALWVGLGWLLTRVYR